MYATLQAKVKGTAYGTDKAVALLRQFYTGGAPFHKPVGGHRFPLWKGIDPQQEQVVFFICGGAFATDIKDMFFKSHSMFHSQRKGVRFPKTIPYKWKAKP
jgi:hypothetical protein